MASHGQVEQIIRALKTLASEIADMNCHLGDISSVIQDDKCLDFDDENNYLMDMAQGDGNGDNGTNDEKPF